MMMTYTKYWRSSSFKAFKASNEFLQEKGETPVGSMDRERRAFQYVNGRYMRPALYVLC